MASPATSLTLDRKAAPLAPPPAIDSPATSRERLEALLRGRKLDGTLTTTRPARRAQDVAAFSLAGLDRELGGGLPRGQVSELVGPSSSGRTSLAWSWLAAATARCESVALIDTFDRFDPETAQRCGIDLSRLLWVRGQAITKTTGALDPAWLPGTRTVDGSGTLLERTIDRAIKALNLVLQSGVCTVVVLDVADVPPAGLRRVPATTWLRLQRIIENTDTACLLMGPMPLARSAGGVVITLGPSAADAPHSSPHSAPRTPHSTPHPALRTSPSASHSALRTPHSHSHAALRTPHSALWVGEHHRSRRLGGVVVHTRMTSPRWTRQARAALVTTTRADAWAVE
jgi:hypothetical protein